MLRSRQHHAATKRGTLHPVAAALIGGIMAMDQAVLFAIFAGLSVSGMARMVGYAAGSQQFWGAALLGAFLGWSAGMLWGAYLAYIMAMRHAWIAATVAFLFGVGILIGFGGLLWLFRHI